METPRSSPSEDVRQSPAQPPRVLYVDDEKEFIDLATRILGGEGGVIVEGVTSGADALQRLNADEEFDVVISDYQMPGMHGIDLLREMRRSGIETPFVIVTGKGREDVAVEALNCGADLYIQKTPDLKVLFSELSTMVASLTERSREARSLLKERDFYVRIMDMNIVGIAGFDINRRIVIWNSGMEDLTGVKRQDIVGARLDACCSESVAALLDDAKIDAALNGSMSMLNERRKIDPASGDEKLIDVSYFPVADSAGRFIGGMILAVDTTERRKVERSLVDSEARLRFLFENAGDGIVIHDPEGRIISANRILCQRLECLKERIVNRSLDDFVVRDQRRGVAEALKRASQSGQEMFESVMISGTGHPLPVEINTRFIEYQGQPAAMSIIRDARERKLAEKELIRSLETREHFESIVNASPVVVFLMRADPLWSVMFVSANVTQFGYTPDDFESGRMSFVEVIHPEDLKHLEDEVGARISAGEPSIELECRILSKGGDVRWIDSRVLIRRDSEGNILDFQGVVLDITERKRYQEETERLAMIVDSSLDAIIGKSLDGTILSWNPAAEELYGYKAEEAIGQPVTFIVPPDRYDEYHKAFSQVKRGKRIPWFETVRMRKDGSRIEVSLTTSPVRDGTGKIVGASAIAKDISHNKRTERALRLANEKLGLLGSLTRHDVVNQVSILMGYLSLLEQDADPVTHAKHVRAAKQACLAITGQLQFAGNYQKAGTKSPEWARVKLELAGAVTSLDMSGVKVDDSTDDLEILADPMFEKVFLNLLVNSRRHGQRVTRISVGHSMRGDNLVLLYSDDGIGIPEADKGKVFEPGFGKDSGLGLFLIKEILLVTGITIREVGTPGEGAAFEMIIPTGNYRFSGQVEGSGTG